jgi:hypothetical protein
VRADGLLLEFVGSAILSQTATLEDVFWGFYSWIDTHPTETLIISVKVDSGPSGIEVQQPVYDLITTGVGATYWLQTDTVSRSSPLFKFLPTLIWERSLALLAALEASWSSSVVWV